MHLAKNTCYIRGKMQYITFDGLNYNLIAGCSYKLVHDLDRTNALDIILNNDPNLTPSSKAKRTVDINVDGQEVHLGNKGTDGGFKVKVGNSLVSLPYEAVPRIKQVRVSNFFSLVIELNTSVRTAV